MTLPHEEVRALKRTHKFMSNLLQATWSRRYFIQLACRPKMRERLRSEAYSCIRHYPFDCNIDRRWPDVCECGDSKRFCKCERKEEE